MQYCESPAPEGLRAHVECIWTLEGDRADFMARPDPILPDGCVEWIVNLGDPVHEILPDGSRRLQERRFVLGQMTTCVQIEPQGAVRFVGMRFHPAGAAPCLRASMQDLAGRCIPADEAWRELDRALEQRLDPHGSREELVHAAEEALLEQVPQDARPDPLAAAASGALLRSHGRVPIERLAADLGTTSRTIERAFREHVGLTPKMLARVLRFQSVFARTRDPRASWADVAVECGYYDQAHLIRDFRQFARLTPIELTRLERPLTEAFTRNRRLSRSSKPEAAVPASLSGDDPSLSA